MSCCLPFMNVVLATSHTTPRQMCLDPHMSPRRRLYMHRARTSRKWIVVLSLEIPTVLCHPFISHMKMNIVVNFMLLLNWCTSWDWRQMELDSGECSHWLAGWLVGWLLLWWNHGYCLAAVCCHVEDIADRVAGRSTCMM